MSPTEDELTLWRLAACEAAGLPPALASRLNGETREAVLTDAHVLAKEATPEPTPTAEAKVIARMALKNAQNAQAFGLTGGQLSPAPNELAERVHGERLARDED